MELELIDALYSMIEELDNRINKFESEFNLVRCDTASTNDAIGNLDEQSVSDEIIPKILDSIRNCKTKGREPRLLIINPKLYLSHFQKELIRYLNLVSNDSDEFIFGVQVIKSERIKDFYIVDDRYWCEQQF